MSGGKTAVQSRGVPLSFVKFKKEDIEQSIPARFEQQVARHPDRLAVKTKRYELSYATLNRIANRVGRAILAQRGDGEEPVALLFEKDAPMMAAILGVLKAGKILLPLDPSLPRRRLAHFLQDSGTPVIVTNKTNLSLANALAGASRQVINIDAVAGSFSEENLDLSTSPDVMAWILYTSSSTGEAKGVAKNHRNFLHAMLRYTNSLQVSPDDRVTLLSGYSQSGGLSDIFRALLNGATLFPFSTKEEGLARLADFLIQNEITIYHSVPSVFRSFVKTLRRDEEFPALRAIHLGGEPVSRRDVEAYKRHFSKNCILLNNLGATETGSYRQYFIDHQTGISGNLVPVGYAVEDVEVLLLDESGHEVPFNQTGEIAVRSRYLAAGYWGRPDLTQLAFRPDPKGGDGRIYRTGDLGRMRPDGCLEYLGRKDFRVKIRGYSIAVGEIEMALLDLPTVKEVVVLAREDRPNDQRLVAYLVPNSQSTLTVTTLRRALAERLPEYMIPSSFVFLDALPLTPAGKVDRRALPAPDRARPRLENPLLAPSTPVEQGLAEIWAEVLGLDHVGIHDNFLDLGGHSLAAAQILSRVISRFGVELPVQSLFEAPTVADMALLVTQSQAGVTVSDDLSLEAESMNQLSELIAGLSPAKRALLELRLAQTGDALREHAIHPRDMRGPCPLSFTQQRLWILDQLEPGSPAYNVSAGLRLSGVLDVAALQKALDGVVARHEALRTVFATVVDAPAQIIAESQPVRLALIDLSERPEREAELRGLITAEARRPFNLSGDLMLRATLLRLGQEEHVLLLVTHHIVTDGLSIDILFREIAALYDASCSGRPPSLPELPIQYPDFAIWQRRWRQGAILESQLSYWKTRLSGAPSAIELPTDRPRPAVQRYRGTHQPFALSKTLTEALKELSRGERVTLFMTLLAAFKTLLFRYTGQADVVIGTPIAGRNRVEIEKLIGFFVNTLVLRTDLSANPSFRELLGRVREVALGAYAHQELPFEKLVEERQPPRDLSRNPLFQVMFVLNTPRQGLEVSGLTLTPLKVDGGTARFDLTLSMVEEKDGLRGALEYATDLFDDATITRMLGHFQTLLEGVVADPKRRLSELPLLTEAERRQILVEWNATGRAYPTDTCVHHLIEAQAARTPERVAVEGAGGPLTYRELEARATRLAGALQGWGVGPEGLVGVCLERTVGMVVALLGVLKAGGAYVPLDPAFPGERLAFMAADAGIKVLLTAAGLEGRVPTGSGVRVVRLDRTGETGAAASPAPPGSPGTTENLAYVIYTSGSTGQPKGVEVPHGALVSFLQSMREAPGVRAEDVLLAVTTLSFDIAALELFLPLIVGARIVVAGREAAVDGRRLAELLQRTGATVMQATPATWRLLLEAGWRGQPGLKILCGGEALPRELATALMARGAEVWNLYGPTETTVWSTMERVEARPGPVLIGRPIANTRCYILDGQGAPVPVGIPGDLCIGGVGVARGYRNRPELTREKFILDPYGGEPGARLYKTGDRARYWADGRIEFLGRGDTQVKVRGFRVELGEVEAVLGRHPALQAAVVTVQERGPGDSRLVAYVVPREAVAPPGPELQTYLRGKLPEYMVPTGYVALTALPLTPNGKVDRRALPAPEGREAGRDGAAAPRTAMEGWLAEVWQEVLGVERVGVQDNFFDLGGHSLLAMQVLARIEQRIGQRIDFRDLLLHTLGQLAAVCDQRLRVPRPNPAPKRFVQQWLEAIRARGSKA